MSRVCINDHVVQLKDCDLVRLLQSLLSKVVLRMGCCYMVRFIRAHVMTRLPTFCCRFRECRQTSPTCTTLLSSLCSSSLPPKRRVYYSNLSSSVSLLSTSLRTSLRTSLCTSLRNSKYNSLRNSKYNSLRTSLRTSKCKQLVACDASSL